MDLKKSLSNAVHGSDVRHVVEGGTILLMGIWL